MNVDVPRAVTFAIALACLCALALLAAPVAPTPADGPASPGVAAAQEDVEEEPPSHRNPDEYDEDADVDRIAAQLSEDLSERLVAAALSMSDGEYEAAREQVGDDYDELFAGYAEATGGDGGGADGGTADGGGGEPDPLDRAARDNEAVADALESFDENRTAYDDAVAAGDDGVAREHARNLSQDGAEIERLAERLAATYRALGEEVTIDDLDAADLEGVDEADLEEEEPFAAAADAIESTAADVAAEVTAVRREAFTATELTIPAGRDRSSGPAEISFTDPLSTTGELRTADGSPVAFERITLSVDGHRERVETDAAGRFTLEHRPTNQSVSAEALAVAYVPEARSPYLGNETSVPVSIEAVEPTLSLHEAPADAAFGDSIVVGGELAVDDVPVDGGIELAIGLDGERLGTATVSNGTFEESVQVPASVAAGEVDLRVALAAEDRALAPAGAETTVDVAETPTELTITDASTTDLERVDGGGAGGDGGDAEGAGAELADDEMAISVAGRLETTDGTPVPDATLSVLADGSAVEVAAAEGGDPDGGADEELANGTGAAGADGTGGGAGGGTIRTGADGSFAATVVAPADAAELSVRYDDEGSSLGSAEATEPVATAGGGLLGSVPDLRLLGAVAAGLAILAIGGWRLRSRRRDRRRDREEDAGLAFDPDTGPTASPTSSADDAGAEPEPADGHRASALLSAAGDRLAEGDPDDAVAAAYAAVRGLVEPRVGGAPLTHWEFYRRYEAAVDGAGGSDERGTDDGGADERRTDEGGADDGGPAELRELTAAYERAVFAPDRVPADEADDVLDHARRLCDAVGDGRVDGAGAPADD